MKATPGSGLAQRVLVTFGLFALLGGCAANRYRAPITGFRTASATAIAVAEQYYLDSNKVERDGYIDAAVGDRTAIDPKELSEIGNSFSAEDIGARIDALVTLSDYSALLLRLATSDAPDQASLQVGAVEKSVNSLTTRVGKLCDTKECAADNKNFKAGVTNVSGVLQPILRSILTRKITRELDQSIQTAEKPVSELIDAIRSDMNNLHVRRKGKISELWSLAVKGYNDEARKTPPDAARMTLLAERVKLLSDKKDLVNGGSPDRALAAMDKAHQALVKLSRKDKSPSNLTELADAVQAFANEAQLAGQSFRLLTRQ